MYVCICTYTHSMYCVHVFVQGCADCRSTIDAPPNSPDPILSPYSTSFRLMPHSGVKKTHMRSIKNSPMLVLLYKVYYMTWHKVHYVQECIHTCILVEGRSKEKTVRTYISHVAQVTRQVSLLGLIA